jgi:hypothetical protein
MSRSKTVKQIREKKNPPQRLHQKSSIAPPIATMVCRYDFKTEEKTSPMCSSRCSNGAGEMLLVELDAAAEQAATEDFLANVVHA